MGEQRAIGFNAVLMIGVGLLVLISISAISYINLNSATEALTIEITKTINSLSFSRGSHIEDLLVATLDQTKALSELDLFQNNLENVNNGVDIEASTAAMQEALEDINDKTNAFYEIQVANNKGIVVAASSDIDSEVDEDVGEDVLSEDYYIEGLKDSFISDANKNDGIPTVSYSSPISTDVSPQAIGVLIIHQAFEKALNGERGSKEGLGIDSITLEPEGLGETGEVYLVSSDKLRITPDRHNLKEDVFLKANVDTPGYQNCFEEGIESEPYVNGEGDLVIGNAEPIKGTDWCILAEIGVEEAFAPIVELRNRSIIVGGVLLLIVLIITFFLSKYISSPVRKLTSTVDEISKGNLEVQLEKGKIKEINVLIDSLNRILASMKLAILRTGMKKEDMGIRKKSIEKTMEAARSKPKAAVKKK